jgi:hypothetical protein
MSVLPILQGAATSRVREWLDLEHGAVYVDTIHWNALVGYHDDDTLLRKYIFHAHNGSEQLICLSKDPHELYDLATEYPNLLKYWRQCMVDQFEQKGRGEKWVKDGVLQVRTESTVYARRRRRKFPNRHVGILEYST